MTNYEWSVAITRIDGNALRAWLEKHAEKTGATQAQIDRIVGETGPLRVDREAVRRK